MTKKTLLITGGSGYLGWHLGSKAADQFNLVVTYRSQAAEVAAGKPVFLDLTNRADMQRTVAKIKPDAIIHAAAINPGKGDEQTMMRVNADGSLYVAEAAVAIGARLVHVSTDVLHDGKHAPYADDAPPSPLNAYGRSKATAEATVTEIMPQAAIVRTSLIYGLEKMDRGTEGFVERLNAGEKLVLFNDVIRQPVWVNSLAEALLKLVNLDFAGTLNVAGRQALTREKFARRMLQWWGVDAQNNIESGKAADISSTIPLDLRLSVSKAEQLLQIPLPGVDEVISTARG